ncbi:MAG: DNA polymerase III subunit beta [Actinobacteria bacterium]|nr:DNA polymerase III subunit beta [Actinomycetota bacterium]
MKIQTTRDELLNKILFVNRAMSPKISNFILTGTMLETDGNNLNIYGTDLETNVKSSIKVKTETPGRVVVPTRIIVNVLKSFPESKVGLELLNETNELKLTCLKSVFKLNTFALEEYPQFPQVKKQEMLKIEIGVLKYLISKVQKAVSSDESRVILTGIMVDINQDSIKLVATDSYRLSISKNRISFTGQPVKAVVPARVLETLARSDISKGEIDINIEENQISFIISDPDELKTVIVSSILSGKFPDYENLIPDSFNHSILINKNTMLDVIKRISSISQDNIPVKLDIEKGRINVSMNIREVGSSNEDFEVSYGEESMQIAFNPDYLIDGLNIIDGEKIMFNIVEPLKPVMLKPEKDKDLLYLLMPIRIS